MKYIGEVLLENFQKVHITNIDFRDGRSLSRRYINSPLAIMRDLKCNNFTVQNGEMTYP